MFDDGIVRVTTVPVSHGHAHPALAFRFDTSDGAVVFSGDTTVNDDLIALARGAEILVHQVADLDYLERHGLTGLALERMAGLQTDVNEVGSVAERAGVRELILSHYLPAEPEAISDAEWAERAGKGFSGRTIAGRDGLRRTVTRAERDRGAADGPPGASDERTLTFAHPRGKVNRHSLQLFSRTTTEGSTRRPSRRRCRIAAGGFLPVPCVTNERRPQWAANR